MTCDEKLVFVETLMNNIKDEACTHIMKGGIPEHWDGHELRQYLADKFSLASFIPMSRKRKREYNNTVMVNNL